MWSIHRGGDTPPPRTLRRLFGRLRTSKLTPAAGDSKGVTGAPQRRKWLPHERGSRAEHLGQQGTKME